MGLGLRLFMLLVNTRKLNKPELGRTASQGGYEMRSDEHEVHLMMCKWYRGMCYLFLMHLFIHITAIEEGKKSNCNCCLDQRW